MDELVNEVDPIILLIAGIVVPLVIAVINSWAWTEQVKALVSALFTLSLGAVLAVIMGVRDGAAILTVAAGTYAWAQITYFGVYRPTGLADTIERNVLPRAPSGTSRRDPGETPTPFDARGDP